ncbi:uncharacterized protein (TIGR02246 family) [Inquilinus ginsengisoli]|uniref:YybH family protein n=1 Tax=Inquilinus ginsengisoli TaxID=363840 RepID=UPI003D215BEA
MTEDERVIRDLVDTWMAASKAGDTTTVLSLMSDDVVFMVPGHEPFGKQAFAAAAGQSEFRIDGSSEIRELQVLGDWAWLRSHLDITMIPPVGQPVRRTGWTLTILHKQPDGHWLLTRDANLLTVQPTAAQATPR